jgi:hypothetical protein
MPTIPPAAPASVSAPRNVGSVFSGQTTDNEKPSAVAARIAIRNILAVGVTETGWSWGSGGPAVMDDFELDHCTILGAVRQAFQLTGANLFRRLKVTNNLLAFGAYTQQWIPALTGEGADVSANYLVNTGGGDGGGPSRNTGWPGLMSVNPEDISLDVATGRHLRPGIGYQEGALPVAVREPDANPGPGSLPDRVTALETDVAELKTWRVRKDNP